MRPNVDALESFYAGPLGQAAQIMVRRRLTSLWPDLAGGNILGYGYPWPYLAPYDSSANRLVAAMPAGQGALAHRNRRGVCAVLCEGGALPFSDSTFSAVLAVHALEDSQNAARLLRELWRVTQPEGRIVVIASARSGLWSRADHVPWGSGRPYSRRQLREALRGAGFVPTVGAGALYAPPWRPFVHKRVLGAQERFGETVWPGFGGVVLVEAIKRLYVEPDCGQAERVRQPGFRTAPTTRVLAPEGDAKKRCD